jgi:hypothetical protein
MNPHSESAYFLNPLMRIFLQSLIEYVENLISVDLVGHKANSKQYHDVKPVGYNPRAIKESDEDDPANITLVVNDDNDNFDDINLSNYPEDLKKPSLYKWDEDVFRLTIKKLNSLADVRTGKIKLTSTSNSDIRLFKNDGSLLAINQAFVNLESKSGALVGALSKDLDLYVEGINGNSHLKIQVVFEANGQEQIMDSISVEILDSVKINLKAVRNSAVSSYEANQLMKNGTQFGNNVLRNDDYTVGEKVDVVTPVTFRQKEAIVVEQNGVDLDGNTNSFYDFSGSTNFNTDLQRHIRRLLERNSAQIYIVQDISGNTAGFAGGQLGSNQFVIESDSTTTTIAHEWGHVLGLSHVCITNNLMWGTPQCSNERGNGQHVHASQKSAFIGQ